MTMTVLSGAKLNVLWLVVALVALVGACTDDDGEDEVDIEPPRLVSFTADPTDIRAGESATLTWELERVSAVTITNDQGAIEAVFSDEEALGGTLAVSPRQTTTYTLSAINIGDSGARSQPLTADVTIDVEGALELPTVELNVDPQQIVRGEAATLAWTTSNVETLTLTANGEAVALAEDSLEGGTLEVAPVETTTYAMVATGAGEQVSVEVMLVVVEVPVIEDFSASPEVVSVGQASVLTWVATAATRVEISDGVESLDLAGKNPLGDSVEVSPAETTTYTLTVENMDGEATATTTVTVRPGPAVTSLVAEPAQITQGDATLITWATVNADAVALFAGDEPVSLEGLDPAGDSVTVSPEATTEFRLVASGPGGEDEASVEVTVLDPVIIERFDAAPDVINLGEMTRLSWATLGAAAVTIVDADQNPVEVSEDAVNGEVVIVPTTTTTYTLTATGPGGQASAEVSVTVDDSVRVSFSAEPELIDEGAVATLSWQTIAADRIELAADPGPAPDVSNLSPRADILEVSPAVTTTYTLTAFGEGGQASESLVLRVNPAVRITTFVASEATVLAGQPVTLSWETQNAARVSLSFADESFEVDAVGEQVFEGLEQTTTFTLTADGVGGPVVETVTVQVREPLPPVINTFSASQDAITLDDSVELSWDVTGADSLTLTVARSDARPFNVDISELSVIADTLEVSPTVSTVYTLRAINDEGEVSAQTSVFLPLTILELSTDPEAIVLGETTTASYRVQGAVRVVLEVPEADFSLDVVLGEDGRGSATLPDSPPGPKTVILTAFSAVDEVVEERLEVPLAPPVIESFVVTPEELDLLAPVDLAWTVRGAATLSLQAEPEGAEPFEVELGRGVLPEGSVSVSPVVTTTYRLRASNGVQEVSREVVVTVRPRIVTFTAEPTEVGLGGATTLNWQVQGAQQVALILPGDEGEVRETVGFDGRGSFVRRGINETSTLQLNLLGPGDEVLDSAEVTVTLSAPEVLSFDADPDTIGFGQQSTLSWGTRNAASLSMRALVQGQEPVALPFNPNNLNSGSVNFPVPVTTTFELTATNASGSDQATARVAVPVQVLSFGTAREQVPFLGQAQVSILAQGALSGALQVEGREPQSFALGVDGAATVTVPNIRETLAMQVTVFGPEESAQASAVIELAPPVINEFTISPEDGEGPTNATLSWLTTGAEDVSISGFDSRDQVIEVPIDEVDFVQGSREFDLRLSTSFTLTASNPEGSVTATVNFTNFGEPSPGFIESFSFVEDVIDAGSSNVLEWFIFNAEAAVIERLGDNNEVLESIELSPEEFESGARFFEVIDETQTWRLTVLGLDGITLTSFATARVVTDPSALEITEVFYNVTGFEGNLEWVELLNNGPSPINLADVALGWGSASFVQNVNQNLPALTIGPGECVVVGGPGSNDINGAPEYDAVLEFAPDIQGGGEAGAGVALFDLAAVEEFDISTQPIDGVAWGLTFNEDAFFRTPANRDFVEETFMFFPDVADAETSGQSLLKVTVLGEVTEERWKISDLPTPGRCFGLFPGEPSGFLDPVVAEGRRRGPEQGGNEVLLRTFNVTSFNTNVFFGDQQAECDDFFQGLNCTVPAGTGVVDLRLVKGADEIVYPGFYTYESADFCNVQFPDAISTGPEVEVTVFGRIFESGVTEADGDSGVITAEVGVGPSGSDPGLAPQLWTWTSASFNVQSGNDDEYQGTFTTPQEEGVYSYAYRFRVGASPIFSYCDVDGAVNNNPELQNFFEPENAGLLSVEGF